MRLFLLPISTRRTLLYCERLPQQLHSSPGQKQSLMEKAQVRAAQMWASWEKKPPGTWQHRVVAYGNAGFRRIAFEEWGLKSVPPLSSRRRIEAAAAAAAVEPSQRAGEETKEEAEREAERHEKQSPEEDASSIGIPSTTALTTSPTVVEIVFPPSVIPPSEAPAVLQRLSTEREPLHRRQLLLCFVGMPLSAPIALIPLIPNLPFFYLVYRAWSHWRALSGGQHIQHLLKLGDVSYTPSPMLDAIYKGAKRNKAATSKLDGENAYTDQTAPETREQMLLSHPDESHAIAEKLDVPQLELELERAIWQVESALDKEQAEKKQNKANDRGSEPPESK